MVVKQRNSRIEADRVTFPVPLNSWGTVTHFGIAGAIFPFQNFESPMTAANIRALRRAIGESTGVFGARVGRSGRTVENWEQGRYQPDALARRVLAALCVRVIKQKGKKKAR